MEPSEAVKQVKTQIENICRQYRVSLVPVIIHQGDRTYSTIDIVPLNVLGRQAPQPVQPPAPVVPPPLDQTEQPKAQ